MWTSEKKIVITLDNINLKFMLKYYNPGSVYQEEQ